MAETTRVTIQGPFHWRKPENVFESEFSDFPGIYVLTIRLDDGDLIYYVGETQRFADRLKTHLDGYLGGLYRIYEPKLFSRGEKMLIWPGTWRKSERHRLSEWEARRDELLPKAERLVDSIRLWLLPFVGERRMRCRLEGAIARHLRTQADPVGGFQETDIRYQRRNETEDPRCFSIDGKSILLGLPTEIEA